MADTVSTVISRTTSGWAAGVVALALAATACSSTSGPAAVEPATTVVDPVVTEQPAEPTAEPTGETAADPKSNTDADTDADTAASIVEPGAENSEPAPPAVPAPEALKFTAPLVGGGEIDLAAGFDNKPTVFWFWAPT
jgi:hypothetical protein